MILSEPRNAPVVEQAHEAFVERAAAIPGVVRVETCDSGPAREQPVYVYVRDGDTEAEYAVYRLRGQMYDQFPESRLEIELFEESDLAVAP